MNEHMTEQYTSSDVYAESLAKYTAKTFGWMFLGLMVTFAIASAGIFTGAIIYVYQIPYWHYILLFAELGVVMFLSVRINKMSVGMARTLFMTYAILNGVVFTAYFLIYNLLSLVMVFGITSLFFGIMAVIGYFGKVDFSRIRPFMTAGLLFLVAFWILSMFLPLQGFERVACTIGIFLFLLFTAYDTQKIKAYYVHYGRVPEMAAKASIFSALQLYLDFINLFLYILRFAGKRRN